MLLENYRNPVSPTVFFRQAKQQPSDFAAIQRLVALYTQVSQMQKALDLLDKSRSLMEGRPDFLRFAAGYDQSHGRGEMALRTARKLVELEPNLPENHYVLARALYFQKDLPGFYAAAAQAIAIGGLPMQSFILQDPSFAPLRQEAAFKKLTTPQGLESR